MIARWRVPFNFMEKKTAWKLNKNGGLTHFYLRYIRRLYNEFFENREFYAVYSRPLLRYSWSPLPPITQNFSWPDVIRVQLMNFIVDCRLPFNAYYFFSAPITTRDVNSHCDFRILRKNANAMRQIRIRIAFASWFCAKFQLKLKKFWIIIAVRTFVFPSRWNFQP